jgi:hypothetical protein
MGVEEVLKAYALDPPQAFEKFVQQLRKLPRHASKWVYAARPPERLVQGDVLGPVEYVAVSEENQHAIVASDVMLVSNTCDLVPEQRDFALVAPVIELDIYTPPDTASDDSWNEHVGAVRRFEVIPYYYLPAVGGGLQESFADFTRITNLPTGYLSDSFSNRVVTRKSSLSLKGHLLLLAKLAHFLVRSEAAEIERTAGPA